MQEDWFSLCQSYIGKSRQTSDILAPDRANALLATLNQPAILKSGDALPPLFHWLYFQELIPYDDLKEDGHQKMGVFLPPIGLPRRMWAGSEVQFIKPLHLGANAERHSHIMDIIQKNGATGPLCFLTIEHKIFQNDDLCLIDQHQIVYRQANTATVPALRTEGAGTYQVDAVTMFRYSALTFNGHRIHYDHDYARNVENYPSIVVHGPLMATMAMRHAQMTMPDRPVMSFAFKVFAPVFENESFDFVQTDHDLISELMLMKNSGKEALKAQITWRK